MMHSCAHCGTTVLFGGTKVDGVRYCDQRCATGDSQLRAAQALPEEVVQRALHEVVEGDCPVCHGPGPVDAFTSHYVLSMIVATRWSNRPRLSCRACATKAQLGGVAYSFFLGWWGVPWGLVLTPVQIGRNLVGLARQANPHQPSPLLETMVRNRLASNAPAEQTAA